MEKEKSCGCIIVDEGKTLLVKQISGIWGFPKGHIDNNETEEQTAIREVKEETNLDVKIDTNKRYEIEYLINEKTLKKVVYFVAEPTGGEVKMQESEIQDIKWLTYDQALETISYDNLKNLFKDVLKDIK